MQDLKIHKIGVYPISKHYIEALDMMSIFNKYIPKVKDAPILSECLCVLIQNIVVSPKPLYQIQEWLKSYADGQGEFGYESNKFTDDRLGEALDELYKSDRQSIMTAISGKAIAVHKLNTSVIHNDTTSVTLQGNYENQSEEGVQIKRGYNKDHRPDCKQIIFGLNVVADGHVPISLHLYDGNTSDDQTHQVNWNELRAFLQTTEFCYVADGKVATKENMQHIAGNKGTFISILPATRKETTDFKKLLREKPKQVIWQYLETYPNRRKRDEPTTYRFFEEGQTTEGYRLIWIHSDNKERIDKEKRSSKIATIALALDKMAKKLNRYKLKTKEQIEQAVAKTIKGCTPFFKIDIKEHKTFVTKKIGCGRPSENSRYHQVAKITYLLEYTIQTEVIKKWEQQDGIFPLVTNTDWTAKQVLKTYKEQPYLEKRFCTLKSVLDVAPIFLKKPERIEAMLLLYFFALMVVSLIERQIRRSMEQQKIESLPILPQGMKTKSPTFNNLRYLFRDTIMVVLNFPETTQTTFLKKGFDKTHAQVLKLLRIPPETYQIQGVNWWKFNKT